MKYFKLALLIFALCGCSELTPKRSTASTYGDAEVNCQVSSKGCLLKRNSHQLIIFFRGWVSPSMANRYKGSRKEVHADSWRHSARDLLFEDLKLGSLPLDSSLFVTGSSHLGLSQEEINDLMEESGATELFFASHSGGFKGLRQTILPMPVSFWSQVQGVWLLDNYYGGASFAQDLERNFGRDFLKDSCFGFVTEHNRERYEASYKRICPNTLVNQVGHSQGVGVCLPFFEKGLSCNP